MSQNVQWTSTVVIGGKTEMSVVRSLAVEAVDIIEVTVQGSGAATGPDTDKQIELQPSTIANQVKFLAIASNRYGDDTKFLEYKVNSTGGSAIRLDQPITLAGTGAVSSLDSNVTALFFTSTLVEDATIRIIVGRDATP